jgi:hypothetical protein
MTGTGPKHHMLLAPVGDARQVFSSNLDIAVDSREQREKTEPDAYFFYFYSYLCQAQAAPAAIIPNQVADMRAALVRLGLTAIAAAEFTDNSITNMNRLCAMTEDDLERFIKQLTHDNHGGAGLVIPFTSQQLIHAIRFWANRMYILGVPYDIALVNEPLAEAWNESRKAEAEAAEAPDDLVKKPEPFKKDTKWRPWKESVITYLHSKTGQAAIPLAYIVREFDQGIPGAIYSTVHEQLVNQAIHHGPEYNTNNGIVYDLLQLLTLNGPAWSWISGFQHSRNGRGAWKALIEFYEGDAMQMRSKQQCYDSIAKATYQGARHNFDFSSYVAIHQQAHQDLAHWENQLLRIKRLETSSKE